jgi:hypothetical protein
VELKGKKRRRRDLAKELKRVVWCVCVCQGQRTVTVATVYGMGKAWTWLYKGSSGTG